MSNLYIRLMTGFFCNKKTIKLWEQIGDDAYWIPPRLWAFAAEHQTDGNMSEYSSNAIAMQLGCSKHATSIKQLLIDVGFLETDGKIHQWEEHNGYHAFYKDRATNAANVRWDRERAKKRKGKGNPRPSTSLACVEHAISMGLKSEKFIASLNSWLQHASELTYSLTPSALEGQLAFCAEIGEERAIKAIAYSMMANKNRIVEEGRNGVAVLKAPTDSDHIKFQKECEDSQADLQIPSIENES